MIKSNFKSNLKQYRSMHQLTQEKLAGILSIGRAKYGSYEEGRAEPSIGDYFVMCNKMGIDDPISFYSDEEYFTSTPTPPHSRMNILCSNIITNFLLIEESMNKLKPYIHEIK